MLCEGGYARFERSALGLRGCLHLGGDCLIDKLGPGGVYREVYIGWSKGAINTFKFDGIYCIYVSTSIIVGFPSQSKAYPNKAKIRRREMPSNSWNINVVADWAKQHPCTPRHAWRPCACGRPHSSHTLYTDNTSTFASNPIRRPFIIFRTWALRALFLAAICITARALYADAMCLYFNGATTTPPLVSAYPSTASPDLVAERFAHLMGIQVEMIEGVLVAAPPLGALVHELGEVLGAISASASGRMPEGGDVERVLTGFAEATNVAAGALDVLLFEISDLVDRYVPTLPSPSVKITNVLLPVRAIKTHALTHFALQRTWRRSPRHAAYVLRHAQRALLAELADGTKRLSELAAEALEALDAFDAMVTGLHGSPAADIFRIVWLRTLDTDRAEARRAVHAIAHALRAANQATQGIDSDNDASTPSGAGAQAVLWGHLEHLRSVKLNRKGVLPIVSVV